MMQATLDPDQLRLVGEALFGSRWQAELAQRWNVNDRTVRSWASGRRAFPAERIPDLAGLAMDRTKEIAAIAPLLRP